MNIVEIEKAIEELSLRHDNLNKELLQTLLLSAGWEKQHIYEALFVYENMHTLPSPVLEKTIEKTTTPISYNSFTSNENTSIDKNTATFQEGVDVTVKEKSFEKKDTASAVLNTDSGEVEEKITFLLPDGTEEKDVAHIENNDTQQEGFTERDTPSNHILTTETKTPPEEFDGAQSVKNIQDISFSVEDKLKEIQQQSSLRGSVSLPKKETKERTSLVISQDAPKKNSTENVDIPGNLPLVPFETVENSWTFDSYKNAFHNDDAKNVSMESSLSQSTPENTASFVQKNPIQTMHEDSVSLQENIQTPHHIVEFEKTPITKTDESLVVLASATLLAIILILGYMYGQGRL